MQWKKRTNVDESSEFALNGYPKLLEELFLSRGIFLTDEVDEFLHPRYEKAHDPFLLQDMDKAVWRILLAIENSEKITIYADYDADAVTAAAVLLRFFQKIEYQKVDYYIPDRFEEGYGVNSEAVTKIAANGTKLIITVDSGINAFEAAEQAGKLGLDVIITDHHQVQEKLPSAVAVVNPHRNDDKYPFKGLTGVGVAFKLVQALQKKLKIIPNGWEKWLLDLVAIGTIADCQSLLGENRLLVKWGLHVLTKTRWTGLKELLKAAEVDGQAMDTYKVGFVIAPRINAAGRVEHANPALELLINDMPENALQLAEKLDNLNIKRQKLTEQVLSEAREQLVAVKKEKILVVAGEGWPQGVIGLVAGKLTNEFARPVLVISHNKREAVGSARSVGKIDIIEAISSSKDLLLKYGGHPQAAGFTLAARDIENFHKQIASYIDNKVAEVDLIPVIEYDAIIGLSDISDNLLNTLENFAPFGIGNPRPKFRINAVKVSLVKRIGADKKHLRMRIKDFWCIGFNLGFWADKMSENDTIDIICELQWNEWNGNRNIQLKIIDIKPRVLYDRL